MKFELLFKRRVGYWATALIAPKKSPEFHIFGKVYLEFWNSRAYRRNTYEINERDTK